MADLGRHRQSKPMFEPLPTKPGDRRSHQPREVPRMPDRTWQVTNRRIVGLVGGQGNPIGRGGCGRWPDGIP
jgi:hypothetical protein